MMKDLMLCNTVNLNNQPSKTMEAFPLLGHGYLASYLESRGFSVSIFDAAFVHNILGSFREALKAEHPRLVGIYGHISSRRIAIAFAREAHHQGLLAVAGGPDATGYYADYLKSGFDVVVLGEGEESVRELLIWSNSGAEMGDLMGISGLAYMNSEGEEVVNPPRPFLQDVDLIPPPRRDESVYAPYLAAWRKANGFTALPIMGARGCPYNCSFCYRPIFGRVYRKRSPELIVAELEECVRRFGVRHFRFIDDTFVVDTAWVKELSSLIQGLGHNLSFDVLARPELITSDLATELRKMGVRRVSMGMESGSDRVLRAMNKGLKADDSKNAARILHDKGIEFLSWIMLGYPGESRSDIRLTRDLLTQVRPDATSISIAVPLPGTSYHKQERYNFAQSKNQASSFLRPTQHDRAHRRYPLFFYLFVRRWLLSEVAVAKATAKGSSPVFGQLLKWLYLAGMSVTGLEINRNKNDYRT